MNQWINESMNQWINESMNQWINDSLFCGTTDGQIFGRISTLQTQNPSGLLQQWVQIFLLYWHQISALTLTFSVTRISGSEILGRRWPKYSLSWRINTIRERTKNHSVKRTNTWRNKVTSQKHCCVGGCNKIVIKTTCNCNQQYHACYFLR